MPVIDLWWADLTAADIALADRLPDSERARVTELAASADRGRRLVGAALLQHAVAAARNAQGAVEVDRTCDECGAQHGRPVVAGGPHLSVAHAGTLVVVATSDETPVGVDVERLDRFTDAPDAQTAAQEWTGREARIKSGGDPRIPALEVSAPVPGYVAAVHLATPDPPTLRPHHTFLSPGEKG